MQEIQLIRVFRMNGTDLPDPDPSKSKDQVLEHYARQYPKLNGGKVVQLETTGDRMIFDLRANFGSKG